MKIRALAIAVAFLAFAKWANAVPVTVNSVQYDITTVTTTFPADSAELMSQPWWGNPTLAQQFATALDDGLGYPNLSSEALAPFFAYSSMNGDFTAKTTTPSFPFVTVSSPSTLSWTFAIVSGVPDSSSTLGLTLMSAAALLLVRRRFRQA